MVVHDKRIELSELQLSNEAMMTQGKTDVMVLHVSWLVDVTVVFGRQISRMKKRTNEYISSPKCLLNFSCGWQYKKKRVNTEPHFDTESSSITGFYFNNNTSSLDRGDDLEDGERGHRKIEVEVVDEVRPGYGHVLPSPMEREKRREEKEMSVSCFRFSFSAGW